MKIALGTHTFGPANGRLSVKTGRTGAAAKAGHNLLIEVTSWQATLRLSDDPGGSSLALDADATSLRILQGTGGMQALGDDDKHSIESTIDDDVLKRGEISFRSSYVQASADGAQLSVRGELTLAGRGRPVGFELKLADNGKLSASAVIKQSDWGIKPYSTLFGALKVSDEVEVLVDAERPAG